MPHSLRPPAHPLTRPDAASDSARALEKKPKYKAAQDKALGEVPAACLVTPFVEAASYSNRPVCTALAQGWVTYLTASRAAMEEQVGWWAVGLCDGGMSVLWLQSHPCRSLACLDMPVAPQRKPYCCLVLPHATSPPSAWFTHKPWPHPCCTGICGSGSATAGDAGGCLPGGRELPGGLYRARGGRTGAGHRQRRAPACAGGW